MANAAEQADQAGSESHIEALRPPEVGAAEDVPAAEGGSVRSGGSGPSTPARTPTASAAPAPAPAPANVIAAQREYLTAKPKLDAAALKANSTVKRLTGNDSVDAVPHLSAD
jgi:hypothetical protein